MNTTYDLFNASQIIDAIHNYYNWTELDDNPVTFATMNHLGLVDVAATPTGGRGKGNYKVEFNKLTGMQTKYTLAAALTAASDNLNLKAVHTTSVVDFITSALTLVNITPREGLGFRIIGTAVEDDSTTEVPCNVAFRVNSIAASPNYTVELMDTNLASNNDVAAAHSIKTGATLYITDFAEFGGEAPTADDMDTTQDFNYLQMYDVSFGKNIVAMSQNTKFDNGMSPLQNAVQTRMFRSINSDILFGQSGCAPASGADYGAQKGLWGMLSLSDTSADTDRSSIVSKVDTGTSVDFWKLEKALAKRNFGSGRLLGLTTKTMSSAIAKAAYDVGETVRTETIQFPKYSVNKRTITIGDTIIDLVCDNTLDSTPVFSDGTNTAAQGHMFIGLDYKRAALMYHHNERYGLMLPKIEPVDNPRKKRTEEHHMIAALTTAVWDKAAHFAYGITGS